MALLLSAEEIDPIIKTSDVIDALELGYKDWAIDKAANGLRTDIHNETDSSAIYYNFKTMGGCWPRYKIATERIVSDLIVFEHNRRRKIPGAPGKRWVGLVLVFSMETGELLAVFTDGAAQRMRVGTTNGLGAKYLARADSKVYGLIGSGFQAEAQLQAMCAVRPIEKVRVFSPTESHRKSFAEKWSRKLGIDVMAVDKPEQAVKGADIVGCATNSAAKAVLMNAWLEDGMFITSLRNSEIEAAALDRCGTVAIHLKDPRTTRMYVGAKNASSENVRRDIEGRKDIDLTRYPELRHIISGDAPGRKSDQEITAFVNNAGIGFQFTVIAKVILEAAKQKGVGRLLPNEWFSQSVHS